MKKVLAVILSVILILQAGSRMVYAETSQENRRIVVISHVNSLPLDDEIIPYATIIRTYGFSAANIEIINEKVIVPRQFMIYGKDLPVNDGKYSYQLKIRSDGTLTFDNDLEIYYQGVDGLYKLNYEIDKNDNHIMIVNGLFRNIILASPLLEKLPEKYSDYITSNISDDTYEYNLDLQTDYGFTFQNRLQFLLGTTSMSFSTRYEYDLPTDVSSVMICCTKGDDSFVIGPIEFTQLDEAVQNSFNTISDGLTKENLDDFSENISRIMKESKQILPQIKEKAESVGIPSASEVLSELKESLPDVQHYVPDYDSQIGNDIKDRVENFFGSWN